MARFASIWPQWHDDYITQHYATGSTADIAQHLQRDPQQVRTRAWYLGAQKAPGQRAKRVGKFGMVDDAMLLQLYASHTNQELADLLGLPRASIANRGNKLGLSKSAETMARTANNTGQKNSAPHVGHFKLGHDTWNKGIRGYSITLGRGHFKAGNLPSTWVPVGTERWTVPGKDYPDRPRYLKRKIAEPNVWRMVHRWMWEQHHGPIPPKHVVVFIDGNSANLHLDNLHCIPRGDLAISSAASVPLEMLALYKLNKQLATAIKAKSKKP